MKKNSLASNTFSFYELAAMGLKGKMNSVDPRSPNIGTVNYRTLEIESGYQRYSAVVSDNFCIIAISVYPAFY